MSDEAKSLTEPEIERLRKLVFAGETVLMERVDYTSFTERYLVGRLTQFSIGCFEVELAYQKTGNGFEAAHPRNALPKVVRNFTEMRSGSIRTLADFLAPVPDDRPAEVIPEDYYTCH